MTDLLAQTGPLALGTRLRRLSDLLFEQVEQLYRAQKIDLTPRFFPLLYALKDGQALGIVELASQIGVSHAAVSQMATALMKEKLLVPRPSPDDDRKRIVTLSPKGKLLVAKVRPTWAALTAVLNEIICYSQGNFIETLEQFEAALGHTSLTVRALSWVEHRHPEPRRDTIDIIEWDPRYQGCFRDLNLHWIEASFEVEEHDAYMLDSPEEAILAGGGMIFFARLHGTIVGTCALLRADAATFEVAKMAVSVLAQRRGVAESLLAYAERWAIQHSATCLTLETNSKLFAACRLYRKHGFIEESVRSSSHGFKRVDLRMRKLLRLNNEDVAR